MLSAFDDTSGGAYTRDQTIQYYDSRTEKGNTTMGMHDLNEQDGKDAHDWIRLETYFADMGQMEDRELSQFWTFAGLGDRLAQNTGLMILQMKKDFLEDMRGIGAGEGRAKRPWNHMLKIANHFGGIRAEFQKLPATIMKVYEPEIMRTRRETSRKPIQMKG
jgi:hypothetical protein